MHNCLSISLKVSPHPVPVIRHEVRRCKHGDYDKANNLLSRILDIDFRNASSLWSHWKVIFLSTMHQYIPSKNVLTRTAQHWLTSDIKHLIKHKLGLFQCAKNYYIRP